LRVNDVILTERVPKSWIGKRRSTITRDHVRKFMEVAPLAPVDILKLNYEDVKADLEAGKAQLRSR